MLSEMMATYVRRWKKGVVKGHEPNATPSKKEEAT
jgi:hypothetical protein